MCDASKTPNPSYRIEIFKFKKIEIFYTFSKDEMFYNRVQIKAPRGTFFEPPKSHAPIRDFINAATLNFFACMKFLPEFP